MRQREDGICYAYSKSDGACYGFQRSEYSRLLSEWMAGRAFFTGVAFYGSAITLKLGDIVAVIDSSPEHLRLSREDATANEREDAISV